MPKKDQKYIPPREYITGAAIGLVVEGGSKAVEVLTSTQVMAVIKKRRGTQFVTLGAHYKAVQEARLEGVALSAAVGRGFRMAMGGSVLILLATLAYQLFRGCH
jgi:hypothetical protein